MVKLAGATPKFVLADDRTGFRLTPAMVESAITPRTRLLILNSPSNPTGAVYSRAELEAIVAVALKHNLYILSDEMYEHLIYDARSPPASPRSARSRGAEHHGRRLLQDLRDDRLAHRHHAGARSLIAKAIPSCRARCRPTWRRSRSTAPSPR